MYSVARLVVRVMRMKVWMLKGAGEQTEESGSEPDSSSEYDSENDNVLAQLIQGQNTVSEHDVETVQSNTEVI